MDFSALLGTHADTVLKVVGILLSVNVVLSFLSAGLNAIKDQTATDLDNKAAAVLGVAASALKKIVDFLSANIKH